MTARLVDHTQEGAPTGRVSRNFNTDWKFAQGEVSNGQCVSHNDTAWGWVNLPHNLKFNPAEDVAEYLGAAWYRKHFAVGPEVMGKKVFIEFEAAMQKAEVWLNGTLMATHVGGYTPFSIDVTDKLEQGDNVMAVRIDTRPNPDWAPGRTGIDFRQFGGLYRDVRMLVTNTVHISDPILKNEVAGGGLFITTPTVAQASSTVIIRTDVVNDGCIEASTQVTTEILDPHHQVVATATTWLRTIGGGMSLVTEQQLTITDAMLWHPNSPHLYQARVSVLVDGIKVDQLMERFGVRRIDWRHEGLFINGKKFRALGANKHQDTFGLGNAATKTSIHQDVKRLKDSGFDFIRTSHYPMDPAFYDAADQLGVLVLNCMTGWQTFNDTPAFKENSYAELRDMIRRDRNHPSVVAWETSLNETNYSAEWAHQVHSIAHDEFPGDQMFTAGWLDYFDVLVGASQAGVRDTTSTKPVIISEWGDWEYGGANSTSRVPRENYDFQDQERNNLTQADNFQEGLNINLGLDWFSADGLWHFSDMSGYGTEAYQMGVTDYYRVPKFSTYLFKSQRDADVLIPGVDSGPMVFIANTWSANSPTEVRVFSNAEQVRLYKNGTLVAVQSPDTGAHTANLPHPPFTFSVGAYAAGELLAEALIGGTVVATHLAKTAAAASKITLTPDTPTPLHADGSDSRMVHIAVHDDAGTVAYTDSSVVNIKVSGPGDVVGPATLRMKGGQLAVWIRARRASGDITVTATGAGLAQGSAIIVAEPVPGLPAPQYLGSANMGANLAIKAVASASSAAKGTTAGLAVDQNPATAWVSGQAAGSSWLMLDLRKRHDMTGSTIVGDGGELHPHVLEFSEDGIIWNTALDNSSNIVEGVQVDDSWLGSGRHVRVTFPENTATSAPGLADFKVYGAASCAPASLDIAQEKSGALASSFTPGHEPAVANNGNPIEYWQAEVPGPAHWGVDLGARHHLTSTMVTWLNGDRSHQYTVDVSNDGETYRLVADKSANTATGHQGQDAFTAEARFVRISIAGGTDGQAPVGMYNFKALGHPVADVAARKSSSATSAESGADAALANNSSAGTAWRSAHGNDQVPAWSTDLGAVFELHGVDVTLAPGSAPKYLVSTSLDGTIWTPTQGTATSTGSIPFPTTVAVRHLRVTFDGVGDDGFAGLERVSAYGFTLDAAEQCPPKL